MTAVRKNGKYVARYDHTYTINTTVRRKYMIEVIGMPKATAWIPMTVNCRGGLGSHAAGNGLKF